MRAIARLSVIALVPLFLLWGCSDDDENKVTGTLTGRVIFHGEWPDSGTVQLSVFTNWSTNPCSWCGTAPGGPPAYYTDAQYFHDPDTTNGAGPDTLMYTISGIALGTYDAIAVGWRAPQVSDIRCDEPVIGLYGADPWGTDSIPDPVVFGTDQPTVTQDVHAYFTMLPIPGCDDRGRITGVARVSGTWPPEGLLVMLTAFPVSGWNPIAGQPTAYFLMHTPADSLFRFTPPFGTYYLSIWTLAQPPNTQWYGSYGIDTYVYPGHPVGTDARPNAIVLDQNSLSADHLVVPGFAPAPHWISGTITFNGTRPTEGLLVLISTTPISPVHPPTGQPFGYFRITDPSEALYAVSGMAPGTYYVSLWNNAQPPNSVCYGAYGYTAGTDTIPDPVTIGTTANDWGVNGISVTGQP